MKCLDTEILGVSETRWTNKIPEAFEKGQCAIIYSCRRYEILRQDVAVMMKKEFEKQLDVINERIMVVQLKIV